MIEQDSQILSDIHKTLAVNPQANQRVMAQNSNVSLGQMNAVLKRCMARGWIAVKNLNMKKVCYYLTPAGLEEVSVRSAGYMKRSFEMMSQYAENVQRALEQAKHSGKTRLVLVGKSKVSFVFEYTCEKLGMNYQNIEQEDWECGKIENDILVVYSESLDEEETGKWKVAGGVGVLELCEKKICVEL